MVVFVRRGALQITAVATTLTCCIGKKETWIDPTQKCSLNAPQREKCIVYSVAGTALLPQTLYVSAKRHKIRNRKEMTMPQWLRTLIFLAYGAGIIFCIYFISGENVSARESAMVGVILTILSILASWSMSHYYSESQHTKALKDVTEFHRTNIKTYARKAAEKVTNLSNELGKLSTYLEKELTRTDYDNAEEELSAKEERIESAIHITNTLKSINDTALSDWEGVIGDELEQRRAEQQEREEEIEDLLSRYESMISSLEADINNRGDNKIGRAHV